jgi:DNA (cytosine-5)-methyltransferase 1
MRHASLFTGIGGFDLAAEWMDWENVFQCEIDSYCNKLLAQNFPKTVKHGDIRQTDFKVYAGAIDVLSGGFPCKQTSIAAAISGNRNGLSGEDSGLWYEYLRVAGQIQPTWVIVENPSGVKKWEKTLQEGLAGIGYTVSRLETKASYFGLPHRRQRYLYVANRNGKRLESTRRKESPTIEWCARLATYGGSWLQYTPGDGRGINGIPYRMERIKAIGNAIVPDMALDVFKMIQEYEFNNCSTDKAVQK